ncbi:MAG: SDR family oxidoreductase [Sphingobium sp.]
MPLTDILSPDTLALWGGAECTINRVGDRFLDQSVLSGHVGRPDDLALFAGLGLSALRYPLLWESFAQAHDPERLWSWHDERLTRLRTLGIRPILGLIHHGSGPRGTDLLSADFASGLAAHAGAAARRYPWVEDWTPVNEPLTTARFSALYGHWYPHARDEHSFWQALLNQVEGTRAAMHAIRAIIPRARLIQTEDLGHTASTPERADQAGFDNMRRWASWDLLTGRFFDEAHPLRQRLVTMGFEERLHDFAAAPAVPDLLGLNHYLTSDRFLDHHIDLHPATSHGHCPAGPVADIEAVRTPGGGQGLEGALRTCWERYGIPIAITEVHNGCTREEQMRWLLEAWDIAERLRSEGIDIRAVTAWSLLGAFDWDSLLTRDDNHYESGIFDLRGRTPRETALAPMLRTLAAGGRPDHPVLKSLGWWRDHQQAPRVPTTKATHSPIMIVGATGTLGNAFAGACRLRGIDYVLTGREILDLRDPASMDLALGQMRPWAVINCAGWVRVDEAEGNADACIVANMVGNLALADACRRHGIHYTCFSSDLVFDGTATRPYVEGDATGPLSVYGRSKAGSDDILQDRGGRTLVIRTASFFSPFDRHNFAVHAVEALRSGQRFRAASDCVTSPTYVPDLVRATLDLIIDDEVGLWHLVSEGALSWADFAEQIADALGLPAGLIDRQPASAMGWSARRPAYAPLASVRGSIMPTLASAIEKFARELPGVPAGSRDARNDRALEVDMECA